MEKFFQQVVIDSTDSEPSIMFIRRQLDRCRQEYKLCNHKGQANRWRPIRLIAVNSGLESHVRFSRDNECDCFEGDYVTLSHCWGKGPFKKTLTTSTLSSFEEGIEITDLPENFQDAIRVTRALKFDYIWIGSLCILQDLKTDWLREANMMRKVYARSSLNIAATSAPDSHRGLFSKRRPAGINSPAIQISGAPGVKNWRVIDNSLWKRQVDDAPLTQRGWVL